MTTETLTTHWTQLPEYVDAKLARDVAAEAADIARSEVNIFARVIADRAVAGMLPSDEDVVEYAEAVLLLEAAENVRERARAAWYELRDVLSSGSGP